MTAETAAEVEEPAPLGVYTETLARLYWRQGYLDEALQIYRHLAAEKPDNPHFQEQVQALEAQRELAPHSSPPEPLPAPIVAVRPESATDVTVPTHQRVTVPTHQRVIDQLEGWLRQLQRQRRRERSSHEVELTD